MPKAILIVLSNAAAGKEDEFNDWYTNRHMPEIVQNVEGFASGQRFKLSKAQLMPNPNAPQYAAIYEIEADDIQAAVQALGAGMGSGKVSMSDSIDLAGAQILVLEPVTDRVTK